MVCAFPELTTTLRWSAYRASPESCFREVGPGTDVDPMVPSHLIRSSLCSVRSRVASRGGTAGVSHVNRLQWVLNLMYVHRCLLHTAAGLSSTRHCHCSREFYAVDSSKNRSQSGSDLRKVECQSLIGKTQHSVLHATTRERNPSLSK